MHELILYIMNLLVTKTPQNKIKMKLAEYQELPTGRLLEWWKNSFLISRSREHISYPLASLKAVSRVGTNKKRTATKWTLMNEI